MGKNIIHCGLKKIVYELATWKISVAKDRDQQVKPEKQVLVQRLSIKSLAQLGEHQDATELEGIGKGHKNDTKLRNFQVSESTGCDLVFQPVERCPQRAQKPSRANRKLLLERLQLFLLETRRSMGEIVRFQRNDSRCPVP